MIGIAVFSKNLAYGIGGAEHSMWHIIREKSTAGLVAVISCKGVRAFNAEKYRIKESDNIEFRWIEPKILMKRFFYWEYLFNRMVIKKYFTNLDAPALYAQNIWAPAAIISFSGKKTYFVRDEGNLNVRGNYHQGVRRIGKWIYDLIEWPAFLIYCHDNRRAITLADEVICNSVYMSEAVRKKFGRTCSVMYPVIDGYSLKEKYEEKISQIKDEDKGVVLIGESSIKGVDVVRTLARKFPNILFYVFGRSFGERGQKGNIVCMPWQEEPVDAYKYAKMVIVPSRWNEAYGRVAAEAMILDLPVIVANKGGLPEAVNYDERKIAYSFGDYIRCVERVFSLNK